MKKTEQSPGAEMRAEYKRSDFKQMTRGKYVSLLKANSNVVVVDPELTEFFPNAEIAKRAGKRRR